ncbi:hypothetical protein [Saccharibacillus deserti]|uniref:hypothetical protein n=1 Tax=Saccharibacillus deserti TaxID=1634444 RepID=UPI0015558546|nr:hypothetical protein [Saccharibacillus deserti]
MTEGSASTPTQHNQHHRSPNPEGREPFEQGREAFSEYGISLFCFVTLTVRLVFIGAHGRQLPDIRRLAYLPQMILL